MPAHLCFLALTADLDQPLYSQMQDETMHRLIRFRPELSGRDDILRAYGLVDRQAQHPFHACDWEGIACQEGLVFSITWEVPMTLRTPIDFRWLPSTAQMVNIRGRHRRGSLETRHLPREGVVISLVSSNIIGTVDLRVLPRKLERLSLRLNPIKGTIQLFDLPPNIRSIDVMRCGLTGLVVDNAALPESLEEVQMDANRMKTVSVTNLDGGPLDQRIVFGS